MAKGRLTEHVNECYCQAKATMELEGFTFTGEDERLIKAVLSGKMTMDELIKMHRKRS